MGTNCIPGLRLLKDIDAGTLCRTASPIPGATGRYSVWPEMHVPGFLPAALGIADATDRDRAEFEIVRKMPVLDARKRRYASVKQYVSDRTLYFGAPSVYWSFAAESDAELETTRWNKGRLGTLKSRLEFGANSKQQKIFYRWVRKAYKLRYGKDADIPELVRRGMSDSLAEKIKEIRSSVRVKKAKEENFSAGGFNPRPIKYMGSYLLGTLSEHGTGMAVDIDAARNPQLTPQAWAFIEKLTGKSVKLRGRWKTEADAEALWQDVKALSDMFVAKVAAETKRITAEREAEALAASGPASKGASAPAKPAPALKPEPKLKPLIPPLEVILGAHHKSLSRGATEGFFHLPLELVLELHGHGFIWGATFGSNVDLHHFELHETPN